MSESRNTSSAGNERRHKHRKHARQTDLDVEQGSAYGSATEYDTEGHRPSHAFDGLRKANKLRRIDEWAQAETETQHSRDRYGERPTEEHQAQIERLYRQTKKLAKAAGHPADHHRKSSSRGQASTHRRRDSRAEPSAGRVDHAADDGEYAPQPYDNAGAGASYGAAVGGNVHGSADTNNMDDFNLPPVNEQGATGPYYDPRYDGPNYRPRWQ